MLPPGIYRITKRLGHAEERELVPDVGIELTTYRLQGGCSTTELIRRIVYFFFRVAFLGFSSVCLLSTELIALTTSR
jgi:hypothetical protein